MEIRKIVEKDLEDFYRIQRNAYPAFGINNFEDFKKKTLNTQTEDPKVNNYGIFQDGNLVGGMKLHDFEINYFGQKFTAGGIGGIAVDLLHKKEKICKTLMEFYHAQYKNAPFLILYPFRPDFYQKMGFGFGPNMYYYHAKPAAFPNFKRKSHLQFLSLEDIDELLAFYNSYAGRTHGLLKKNRFEFEGFLKSPNIRVIAYKKDGKILGYMCFTFSKKHKGNSLVNDLVVYEHAWEDRTVFAEFMTFLHTQNDQIERIFYPTFDKDFYHVLADVRYSSGNLHPPVYHESYMGSAGLMYKIKNAKQIMLKLSGHNFGDANCRVKFIVEDDFSNEKQNFILKFANGRVSVSEVFDVEAKLQISEFSSIFVGALSFEKAHFYGQAQVSDEKYIPEINKIFANQKTTRNLTWF